MNAGFSDQARTHLSGASTALEAYKFLTSTFFPKAVCKMNTNDVRKRIGLYGGDRIPENERNLTDSRNRVSLIFEYELARVSNELATEAGIEDLFWSYVVANRFPDLEIRKNDGSRGLRVEVKCIQSLAEEKSANFDTLRKDIHPDSDFVAVFVWEWDEQVTNIEWNRSPKVLDFFVFHASSLAELRDTYWLNRPPSEGASGGNLQGFDVRYAVNATAQGFNEEEGNYGKLLRIWDEAFEYRPVSSEILDLTEQAYLNFKTKVIQLGFVSICNKHLGLNITELDSLNDNPLLIVKDRIGFCLRSSLENSGKATLKKLIQHHNLAFLYVFSDKYQWAAYIISGSSVKKSLEDRKPKNIPSLFGN